MWISLIADFFGNYDSDEKMGYFQLEKLLQNQKVKLEIFRSFYGVIFHFSCRGITFSNFITISLSVIKHIEKIAICNLLYWSDGGDWRLTWAENIILISALNESENWLI